MNRLMTKKCFMIFASANDGLKNEKLDAEIAGKFDSGRYSLSLNISTL